MPGTNYPSAWPDTRTAPDPHSASGENEGNPRVIGPATIKPQTEATPPGVDG